MNGKGDTPRPLSVPRSDFADRFDRIFAARRELTAAMKGLCPVCHGEGRDPDRTAANYKNACPECGGDGKRKEAA